MGHSMLHTVKSSNRQIQTPPSSGRKKDAIQKKKKKENKFTE